jgi:hypothetical protein
VGDWKSGLRQAADRLQLEAKANARAKAPAPTPVVKTTIPATISERPAILLVPGHPSHALAGGAASPSPRAIDTPNPLPPSVRKPVGKHTTPSLSRSKNRVKPLAPPLLNPRATGGARTSLQRSSPMQATATARKSHAKPEFSPPNMGKYVIGYGSASASADQSWQATGIALTLRESEGRGRMQCTLGLDFGTAFTKACVQFRQSTFVVHWDSAVDRCGPGLLPGIFTINQDGGCVLGSAPGGQAQGDLKMSLLNGANTQSRINATAFLALVTRYVRSWLFSQHANVFRGFQLEWFINVGLPAVPWDDLELRELYRSITLAGWNLGTADGEITIPAAASVLEEVQASTSAQSTQLFSRRIAAFPEFVAQINSYRKSPQRRRDLHLLVDVGAGTVDIVTFHVWEPDDEDCYSILDASVENRGTHVLLGYRADAGKINKKEWEETCARLRMGEFESTFGLTRGKLGPVQQHFVELFHFALEKVLRKTKALRYETSPAWREGVPFFICGGGREVDAYRAAISTVQAARHLTEIDLPWPDGLVAGKLHRRDFHRVSVAHGLSYAADNIGQIERKSEVPNLQRSPMTRRDISDRYVSKSDC